MPLRIANGGKHPFGGKDGPVVEPSLPDNMLIYFGRT